MKGRPFRAIITTEKLRMRGSAWWKVLWMQRGYDGSWLRLGHCSQNGSPSKKPCRAWVPAILPKFWEQKSAKKMTPKNAKTLENQGLRASNKSCSQLFSNWLTNGSPPGTHKKLIKRRDQKNAKPLENQGLPKIKQNPENIFSGFWIWWTIRGSNPGHPVVW